MEQNIILTDASVRQIFPGTHPELARGEEGYIAYNFDHTYPSDLAIFCPLDFPRSSYNPVLPRDFEASFKNLDSEVARLSRQHEVELRTRFDGYGVEFMVGRTMRRMNFSAKYTIFRFDGLEGPKLNLEMLCRVSERNLDKAFAANTDPKRAEMEWDINLLNANYRYHGHAGVPTGEDYTYWTLPVSNLFNDASQLIAAVFMMSLANQL